MAGQSWCVLSSRIFVAPTICLIRVPRARKQGVLAGFDQKSNVVLSESKERVYSMEEGVEEIPLGLYLVKGDMMSVLSHPLLSDTQTVSPTALSSGK